MSGRRAEDMADIGPDDLVRLEVAAAVAFRDGSIKLSSLRREARRGRLTIWRIANKDMTTVAEIRRMVDRCLVPQSLPVSGSDRPEIIEPRHGSSSTADVSSALAAARLRAKKLSESSKSTSAPNAIPQLTENVVRIEPR